MEIAENTQSVRNRPNPRETAVSIILSRCRGFHRIIRQPFYISVRPFLTPPPQSIDARYRILSLDALSRFAQFHGRRKGIEYITDSGSGQASVAGAGWFGQREKDHLTYDAAEDDDKADRAERREN